ncbi:MAG: hypothetical protein AAGI66_07745 [Cyanobacteria bacterium P01_H01_bin.74]
MSNKQSAFGTPKNSIKSSNAIGSTAQKQPKKPKQQVYLDEYPMVLDAVLQSITQIVHYVFSFQGVRLFFYQLFFFRQEQIQTRVKINALQRKINQVELDIASIDSQIKTGTRIDKLR